MGGWWDWYGRKMWPPYYKYSVFVFVGFEFVYSAFILAISEAYYKSAAMILPIAYRMFDDTVRKNKSNFDWTTAERDILEGYKNHMLLLWIVSTVGVLLCMVVIIPQFFDFNDRRGNPSHLCLVRRKLAWVMFFVVAAYVAVLGIAVFLAWLDGGAASRHFHSHFDAAEKEETFIGELEAAFGCETDDDLEVAPEHMCYEKVNQSFITSLWLNLLMLVYIAGHLIAFLAVPFFNRQLVKDDDELLEVDGKLLDA
ncbi:unnamed protein product [Caenorhabditis auriculariae]|uniref:Uncharacterized protein n=1 Tax=Caenorhabditis auriculariae TaxID=2777116 RepID=A0A8S1HB65_9PELO|nr:unnamed protein product [Caenorhabditis auriculariae]